MNDGFTPLQIEQLRALIRDEIAADHCEAFGEAPLQHAPLDIRESRSRSNQPSNLTDGDCAIRGGGKVLGGHNGANSPGEA